MDRRQFVASASAGVAAAATAFPKPAIAQGVRELKMVTIWPKGLPGLQSGADRVAQSITALSGGRLQVKVFPAGQLVGAMESFDAVSSGLADMYHASEITWAGRSAAFSYFCNVPFGFTPNEINAWIYHDGGQALWARLASRPQVQLGSTVPSVTSASVPGTRCSFIRPTGLEAAPGDLDNQALRHRVVATEDRPAEQNQAHHPTRGRT
jgi:TRAP-type mannitol/chloroaromatic compound transport system substrate-binding protein